MPNTTNALPLTTKQLLSGINPFFNPKAPSLDEAHETLNKIQAVVSMLLSCDDDTGKGLTLQPETVSWALLLLFDLVEEADRRVDAAGDHIFSAWNEMERRLNGCLIIPAQGNAHADRAGGGES